MKRTPAKPPKRSPAQRAATKRGVGDPARRRSPAARVTIRGLDPAVAARLRARAAQEGVSVEEVVRRLIADAVPPHSPRRGLGTAIRRRFADIGFVELELPAREPVPDPPVFD